MVHELQTCASSPSADGAFLFGCSSLLAACLHYGGSIKAAERPSICFHAGGGSLRVCSRRSPPPPSDLFLESVMLVAAFEIWKRTGAAHRALLYPEKQVRRRCHPRHQIRRKPLYIGFIYSK